MTTSQASRLQNGIQRRPRAYQCSDRLLAQSRDVKLSDWAMAVKCRRPDGTTGRVVPRVHYGTFASGEKVVAEEDFTKPLEEVWTELVAVEMEGLGVAVACHQHHPQIDFLLIKAICDWADPEKRDEWQPYAAAASAAFAVAIVQKLIPSQPSSDTGRDNATFDSSAKLRFIQRIGPSWKDLADALGIEPYERNRFVHGDEPRPVWEWLQVRGRLGDLRPALSHIGPRTSLRRPRKPSVGLPTGQQGSSAGATAAVSGLMAAFPSLDPALLHNVIRAGTEPNSGVGISSFNLGSHEDQLTRLLAHFINAIGVLSRTAIQLTASFELPPLPQPHISRIDTFADLARKIQLHPVVAVAGYPKSGKTTALAEFARPGCRVFVGSCAASCQRIVSMV